MAKAADLEERALDTLFTLALRRADGPLTDDDAVLLSFTEQWLDHNTDGMRMPPVAGEEQARG